MSVPSFVIEVDLSAQLRINPAEEDFDIYALCLCNAIIMDMQPLVKKLKHPYNSWLADVNRRWSPDALTYK